MASVKNLKKDIDYLMSQVLTDCFHVLEVNNKVDEAEIMLLVNDVVSKHYELRMKAQHPDGKDAPEKVKTFYKSLVNEMLASADSSFEKLSAIVKKSVE
jgi:hypothetical protein